MNPAQSVPYFSRAWELAEQLGETFFSVEAAVMLSISQSPKLQNEWLQKVIELAEHTQDENSKLWLTQLYVMDGWHSFDFRKYEHALTSFERALSAVLKIPQEHKERSIGPSEENSSRPRRLTPKRWHVQRGLAARAHRRQQSKR